MAKSIQAQAAAQIKNKMKAAGFSPRVSSFSASMCNGVRIYCKEADMANKDQINKICMPYQQGHFNSMEDIYEYSNTNEQVPQVKFVQIEYYG